MQTMKKYSKKVYMIIIWLLLGETKAQLFFQITVHRLTERITKQALLCFQVIE